MVILYFVHVPRTGGNSIGTWLNEGRVKCKFNMCYDGHAPYKDNVVEDLKKKDKVVSFTMIRDPVDLSSSLYGYIKIAALHFGHKRAKQYTFSEWLEKSHEHINFLSRFFNCYDLSTFVNPTPEVFLPSVDLAESTLKKFDYILDTKNLKRDLAAMCKKEGIDYPLNSHIGAYPKPEVSEHDIKRIKEISSRDYELMARIAPHITLR